MMILKLFSFVFVSLLLVVVAAVAAPDDEVSASSPTSAPLTETTFPPTSVVDTYVLRAVGEGGVESPHGTDGITNMDQLTIVTFFEAHQSHFETGINKAISIEVYANVPEGQDCMTGTLLESVGDAFTITTEATPYDEYNTDFPGSTDYPELSEGKIGKATVTISDFQYTPTDDMKKQIWFPGRGDKDGQIEVCIMVALTIGDDNNNGRDDQEYYN